MQSSALELVGTLVEHQPSLAAELLRSDWQEVRLFCTVYVSSQVLTSWNLCPRQTWPIVEAVAAVRDEPTTGGILVGGALSTKQPSPRNSPAMIPRAQMPGYAPRLTTSQQILGLFDDDGLLLDGDTLLGSGRLGALLGPKAFASSSSAAEKHLRDATEDTAAASSAGTQSTAEEGAGVLGAEPASADSRARAKVAPSYHLAQDALLRTV